jgi:hypothetical protein
MANKSSGSSKSSSPAAKPPMVADQPAVIAAPTTSAVANGFSAKPQPTPDAAETLADADLADSVAQLQQALTQATAKEKALESTIAELQSKLTSQLTTIDHLQADLKTEVQQSQQLQGALTKAEAAARQLATLNETLIAENASLKTENLAKAKNSAPPSQPAAKPKPEAQSSQLAARPPSSQRPADGNSMMHPVFPDGALPSGINEKDIGWFD